MRSAADHDTTPRPGQGHRDPFGELNEQQRQVVEFGIERLMPGGRPGADAAPLLVVAGAGSGKTHTLASRLARLVCAGADPNRILLLTFSRRAAADLERRAGHVLRDALRLSSTHRPPSLPWAGTFHAIGARLLRELAPRIGLSASFTIHDRPDSEDLMSLARHALGLSQTEARFPQKGTCLAIYSRAVNSQGELQRVLTDHYPWCSAWEERLRELFGHYAEEKQRQQILDYDDLLLYWAEALQADASLAAEVGGRFDHVLVDEYQDTNRLQAAILSAMKPHGNGVTVVGDDAQSIYSFRSADVRNILDFPATFGRPAVVMTLERNYRSTQPILDASNAVIAQSAERFAKRLWNDAPSSQRPQLVTVMDESQQAAWISQQILERREAGHRLRSQAVLFRASSHSAPVELELARRNIPFVKFGGLKFLEASHVKDVLSVLRWIENPRSRLAGFRVAQLVPGIGPATARRLTDEVADAVDPAQALRAFKPPAAAAQEWKQFVQVHDRLLSGAWPSDLEQVVGWYRPQLERLHDDAAIRLGDLRQLVALALGFGSRERFLTELTLDPPEATSDEAGPPLRDEDYVILSTIHSAKGQEWNAVYVLNAVDGCIPSDMGTGDAAQLEEERRLLYVAMTRARQHLQLIVPQRFYVTQQTPGGDRHLYGSLTRFIPSSIQRHFEAIGWNPMSPSGDTATVIGPTAAVDVGARLRSRWR